MKQKTNSSEFHRFLSIHEQLYLQTLSLINNVTKDVFSDIPIESDVMFLGTRVNSITISNLLKHLIIAETHWIKTIKNAKDGDVISVPKNTELLNGIPDGKELINKYKELYQKSLEVLHSYERIDLEKHISFFNRKYTGIGFLWVLFGHHSYHLGQIDILMRQNNINPIEYMEWSNDKTLIL